MAIACVFATRRRMGRDHRKRRVFHDAHVLAVETHRQTYDFPREERFGLRSEMRRAAVSIATNIVEALVERVARLSEDEGRIVSRR